MTLRRVLGIARLLFGVGLLAWVLTGIDIGPSVRQLAGTWWLWLIVLVPLIGAAIEARRLAGLYDALGITLPFGAGYRVVAISTFFNFAVPGGTGGDVAKVYYMVSANRERGIEAATVVVVDRLLALFAWLLVTLMLAILDYRLVLQHWPLQAMVGTALLGALGLIALGWASSSPTLRATRLFRYLVERAPLHRFIGRIADALYVYRDRRDAWLVATLWSLLGHFSLIIMFGSVASVLLPQASLLDVALLCFVGMLANALPITPGGLGVGEVAFDRLFALLGIAGGAQLVLAWRLASMPLGLLGGLLYLWKRRPAEPARLSKVGEL